VEAFLRRELTAEEHATSAPITADRRFWGVARKSSLSMTLMIEAVAVAPRSRAIATLDRAGVPFRVHRLAPTIRDGPGAARALGVDPRRILKTLVASVSDSMALALVPVSARLDVKALARVLGTRRVALAGVAEAERVTGYRVGAISPLGLRHALSTVIDSSVRGLDTVFVSGGGRGLELELSPTSLATVVNATFEAISNPPA
jgi:Cys-tRNA(Pro)/Cys-tRNA(Cys) deacylase